MFRHNGWSDPKASFEKGSETRSNKRKGKAILFTKVVRYVGGMKKAAELEDSRKTVLGMAPTKSLSPLD